MFMDFFQHQDRAQRNTRYLILLLILAVVALVLTTGLLLGIIFFFTQSSNSVNATYAISNGFWKSVFESINIETMFWITLGISSVIVLGSLFRYVQLQAGGRAVAESVGGQLLQMNTTDLDERKMLNVVEEMAIASGTSVPPVYLLEDESINAFAAGYHPQDAVIGVTRGCIQRLTRDELQGVVAHEFSHIFHGDMRINMRLIALLYGILVIGLIGQLLLRSASHRSLIRSSRDKSPGAILALGVGLIVIGYSGTFFGNLIKAAVSRQREFLADASAVKFTRNPDGIAGALKKIGNINRSQIHNEQAAEFSHMYFSQGVNFLFKMMATHPPLAERIKRIQPRWDGDFPQETFKHSINHSTGHSNLSSAQLTASQLTASPLTLSQLKESIAHIADPLPAHIDYAQERLAEITPSLKKAIANSFSARAVILGLLLDKIPHQRKQQLAQLSDFIGQLEFEKILGIMIDASMARLEWRLPLIELSFPALKQMTKEQTQHFFNCLELLIRSDDKISLFEWSLYRTLLHNLGLHNLGRHNLQPRQIYRGNKSLAELKQECGLLLSLIVQVGAQTKEDATNALNQAQKLLDFSDLTLIPKTALGFNKIDTAIDQLNQLKPLQKPLLLKAMSQCIQHDGKITFIEAETFRALADSLDCPLPPPAAIMPSN
jgi:Zn-dependent protease with chaperone function